MSRFVSPNPRIDTGEVAFFAVGQCSAIGLLRLLQTTEGMRRHALPEQQFRIIGKRLAALAARLPGFVQPALGSKTRHQQRVGLADMGLIGMRAPQATLQILHRPIVIAHVGVRHAQVEQHERMLRFVLQFQCQDPKVPLVLALASFGRVVRSRMNDEDIGPSHVATEAAYRREHLFVNAELEMHADVIAEHFDMVHDG